jgi:cell division protein FtsL
VTAPARPVRHASVPAADSPRRLRLVELPGPAGTNRLDRAARRRRARVLVVLGVAGVGVVLLSLVAAHVVITQNQFRLEGLQARAEVEQERYERLRLHVAELEAPARIVAAAQERLGMVPPPGITYLSATGVRSGTVVEQPTPAAETAAWSRVKRQLASGP